MRGRANVPARAMTLSRAAALLAAAALPGCSQPEIPPDHYYRIEAPTPERSFESPLFAAPLEVQLFKADGLAGGRPLVWGDSASPEELRQYHYHYWSDPPPQMLQQLMIVFLRAANAAPRVSSSDLRTDAEFVLFGKLRRFEQRRGANPRIIIDVEFGVNRPRGGEVLLLGDYRAEVSTDGESVNGAVRAFATGVAEIYSRLLADLAAAS